MYRWQGTYNLANIYIHLKLTQIIMNKLSIMMKFIWTAAYLYKLKICCLSNVLLQYGFKMWNCTLTQSSCKESDWKWYHVYPLQIQYTMYEKLDWTPFIFKWWILMQCLYQTSVRMSACNYIACKLQINITPTVWKVSYIKLFTSLQPINKSVTILQ